MNMQDVFTGKHGVLTLTPDKKTPEGTAASTVLAAYGDAATSTIARLSNIEVYVDTALEEFHQIGFRHAVSIHPGDIHIHGKVGRAYVNGAMLFLLQGKGATDQFKSEPYVQPAFDISLALNDPAVPTSTAIVSITGVKFATWMHTIPEDGFIMENLTFKALAINVVDKADKVTSVTFK